MERSINLNINNSYYTTMDHIISLPLELIDEIACDEPTYHALLSLPAFARSLTIGRRFDFMVKFGYDFHVKRFDRRWYNIFIKNGLRHRLNGPAVKWSNGTKFWYINGKLHRSDGPAAKYASGTKLWYINGERHRVDGPAEEWVDNGGKIWRINGIRHRIGGPAVENFDGNKYWYIYGTRYKEADYYLFTANM